MAYKREANYNKFQNLKHVTFSKHIYHSTFISLSIVYDYCVVTTRSSLFLLPSLMACNVSFVAQGLALLLALDFWLQLWLEALITMEFKVCPIEFSYLQFFFFCLSTLPLTNISLSTLVFPLQLLTLWPNYLS